MEPEPEDAGPVPVPVPVQTAEQMQPSHTPLSVAVLVVAGRRLHGEGQGTYTRALLRRGKRALGAGSKTQVCSFGSDPVWNDDAFEFEFARVDHLSLHLLVYSRESDGNDKLLYSWHMDVAKLSNVVGWIDLEPEPAAGPPSGAGDPPQLNVAIRFRYSSLPLHLSLLTRHLPKGIGLNPFRLPNGESVLVPSTAMLNSWLERLNRRRSSVVPLIRLILILAIMTAFFVVPGLMLFTFYD